MSSLVIDVGNFRIKGAFFENDRIASRFALPAKDHVPFDTLKSILKSRKFDSTLIASVNSGAEKQLVAFFKEEKLPYQILDFKKVKLVLDVEEPEQLGHDRIANCYGALSRFPESDCIIVDIGTAVTFDFVKRRGIYIGGAIYPGPEIGAKALAEFTNKLPLVTMGKPVDAIAKSTTTHIQSGLYWGLLGAIERIVDEMRLGSDSPSSIKIIATGGKTSALDENNTQFLLNLAEIVDLIDPDLTLIGIYEILKEQKRGELSL